MAAQSLVLCRDPETLGILRPLLSEFDMGVEVCLGLSGARHVLHRPDLKTVIVECDEDGVGFEFLEALRRERPQAGPVVVGIVNDYSSLQLAFAHGANFVLSKPISLDDAKRILRMARGFVTRMVRRFLRIAVHRLAHVRIAGLDEPAFLLDLSEGGIAVQALEPLSVGQRFGLTFLLPGTAEELQGTGQVIWADNSGRAGVEFAELADTHRLSLKQWIDAHADRPAPSVASATEPAGSPPEASLAAEPPVSQPEPNYPMFDLPAEQVMPPARIFTAGWMRVAARTLDTIFIVVALALFWYTVVARLGEFPSVRWVTPIGMLMALVVAGGYFSLFYFLDASFPGTRIIDLALSAGHEGSDDDSIFR